MLFSMCSSLSLLLRHFLSGTSSKFIIPPPPSPTIKLLLSHTAHGGNWWHQPDMSVFITNVLYIGFFTQRVRALQ